MRLEAITHTVVVAVLSLVASLPLTAQGAEDAAVDALFAEWDRPSTPGCALGVIRGGALTLTRGYGTADLETGAPNTTDVVFYLASVSKQFTAAAAVLLALDGRMSLDDDVRDYLPELPDYGHTITVRHLLTHTSGLRDYFTLMDFAGMSLQDAWAPSQILELVARQEELNFTPGDRYLYSNTGYFLIPIIIERVTGQSLRAFTDQRIFQPLGMTSTHYRDDHTQIVPGLASSYTPADTNGFVRSFLDRFDQVGSGGLLSTVEDLARWDANFYSGAVGGPDFLQQLHTRAVLASGDAIDYALGLYVSDYKGVRTVSHDGGLMGFRTSMVRFPDERFSVICLCNLGSIDPESLAYDIADLYLTDVFAESLAAYAGHYHSKELNNDFVVRVEGGTLIADRPGQPPIELRSLGGDRFEVWSGLTLAFERDTQGRVTLARLNAGRASGMKYVRQ